MYYLVWSQQLYYRKQWDNMRRNTSDPSDKFPKYTSDFKKSSQGGSSKPWIPNLLTSTNPINPHLNSKQKLISIPDTVDPIHRYVIITLYNILHCEYLNNNDYYI